MDRTTNKQTDTSTDNKGRLDLSGAARTNRSQRDQQRSVKIYNTGYEDMNFY